MYDMIDTKKAKNKIKPNNQWPTGFPIHNFNPVKGN